MSAAHQLSMTPESQPENIASIAVIRYLDANSPASPHRNRNSRGIWITSAVACGVLFGFGMSFCFDGKPGGVPQHWARVNFSNMTQRVVSVPYDTEQTNHPALAHSNRSETSTEIEQIKTRNRRLEALVKVLRQRNTDKRRTGSLNRPG